MRGFRRPARGPYRVRVGVRARRRRRPRRRLLALAGGGCGPPAAATRRRRPSRRRRRRSPARGTDRRPAAAAGGACQLLDYYAVEQLIGVQFEVAASAQRDTTATCVLQRSGVGYPDLTLAVTPTAVAAAGFEAAAARPGAPTWPGWGWRPTGSCARRRRRNRTAPGPAVEIGWLTQDRTSSWSCATGWRRTNRRARRTPWCPRDRPGEVPRPGLSNPLPERSNLTLRAPERCG